MPSYRITIDIKDVGPGDIANLWDHLENEIGPDFDIDRGDFAISCTEEGEREAAGGVWRHPVSREDLEV